MAWRFTSGNARVMLELTSMAVTSSRGMFSAPKLDSVCSRPSLYTLKSAGFSPVTNRPVPSVTTAVTWITSTFTASANCTARVRAFATSCPPPSSVTTARMTCSLTVSPASHSQENGATVVVQTWRPFANQRTCRTWLTIDSGSKATVSRTAPIR